MSDTAIDLAFAMTRHSIETCGLCGKLITLVDASSTFPVTKLLYADVATGEYIVINESNPHYIHLPSSGNYASLNIDWREIYAYYDNAL